MTHEFCIKMLVSLVVVVFSNNGQTDPNMFGKGGGNRIATIIFKKKKLEDLYHLVSYDNLTIV